MDPVAFGAQWTATLSDAYGWLQGGSAPYPFMALILFGMGAAVTANLLTRLIGYLADGRSNGRDSGGK